MDSQQHQISIDHTRLTFFNRPRIRTGSIFIFSEIDSCALAPAPAAVILPLYAVKISTSFEETASRLFSKLCVIQRSTALLARRVAMATWSAEEYNSDRLLVVGSARLITRIRRSPESRNQRLATWPQLRFVNTRTNRSRWYVTQQPGT